MMFSYDPQYKKEGGAFFTISFVFEYISWKLDLILTAVGLVRRRFALSSILRLREIFSMYVIHFIVNIDRSPELVLLPAKL